MIDDTQSRRLPERRKFAMVRVAMVRVAMVHVAIVHAEQGRYSQAKRLFQRTLSSDSFIGLCQRALSAGSANGLCQ
ncbi:hypothetical protein KJI95_00865 [Shewanella sp. JM162201]|uniref:Uncharacterized protein n=1 Tax=Shewanella jiangmenensis TaxID=2837387 RepID=A0ABS5UY97_9GAMM|nr:hypothetical protein [Shewanella jiangmenensis]MBT1443079.1 hypothetical protein [Shewanella jiangmenensis]